MKLRSFLALSLFGLTLAALVPAGSAAAQPQPTMTISPASGPCDATVEISGRNFPANTGVHLEMVLPMPQGPQDWLGPLTFVVSDSTGQFALSADFGFLGACAGARLNQRVGSRPSELWFLAVEEGVAGEYRPGDPGVLTYAAYEYTTTEGPEPQPLLQLIPSSGPCDAPVQAMGSKFRPPPGVFPDVELYLLQPGAGKVNMDYLTSATVERDGTFTQWAGLRERGCEAAALDIKAEETSGHLSIAAVYGRTFFPPGPLTPESPPPIVETPFPRGEAIPSIVAVGNYRYTTTTVHVPTEALEIYPASGPCDGTVRVAGTGFEPGVEVLLEMGHPASDSSLGTLASATADSAGQFVVEFSLGDLGCQAAELHDVVGDPERPDLYVVARPAVYPTPMPPGIPPIFGSVKYRFTTTTVGAVGPQALPMTGHGRDSSGRSFANVLAIVAFAGAGLTMIVAACWRGRTRRSRLP